MRASTPTRRAPTASPPRRASIQTTTMAHVRARKKTHARTHAQRPPRARTRTHFYTQQASGLSVVTHRVLHAPVHVCVHACKHRNHALKTFLTPNTKACRGSRIGPDPTCYALPMSKIIQHTRQDIAMENQRLLVTTTGALPMRGNYIGCSRRGLWCVASSVTF